LRGEHFRSVRLRTKLRWPKSICFPRSCCRRLELAYSRLWRVPLLWRWRGGNPFKQNQRA